MTQYQWPCWWGGVAAGEQPPQIAEYLPKLRELIGGLKAEVKKGGPKFAIKSSKDLMDKLRAGLDELGMVDFVVELSGGNIPLVPVVDGDGDVVGGEGTLAFLLAKVRLGCPDGSYVDYCGAGHGADQQDKAGGKASTYAWKDAHIKGLTLPDDDMVDTDDEEKPIKSGVRQGGAKKSSVGEAKSKRPTKADVEAAINDATNIDELKAAKEKAKQLSADEQAAVIDQYNAKKAELSK